MKPLSRRTFLAGAASLPLVSAFGPDCSIAAAAPQVKAPAGLPEAVKGKRPATAKSVIQIWMWGGPSHLDTFDPKPEAGSDYTGPLNKPIATNVDGIRIGQELMMLAQQADKFSIIRSMTHGINAHETASYRVQTGHQSGTLTYPSIGAVISMFKGYDYGYNGVISPYVVLTSPQGRFSESGFLGSNYKPFCTGGDPSRDPFLVEGFVVNGLTKERQVERRNLLKSLNTLGNAVPNSELFQQIDKSDAEAYELIHGDAVKVFNLTTEKPEMRERYGRNQFGQACLVARRLVEIGVPYITINYRGWDTHKRHFEILKRKNPEMDRGFATLLADLHERGLLDSTVVWWGGEFGRTPKVQWQAPWNGGRSHFGRCFSSVVAGGGFKGGRIVGTSNKTGEEVAERPVYPEDLLGSIIELFGINPDAKLPNPKGLDVAIMAPPSEGGRLYEIMD